MPNWCRQVVKFEGTDEDIAKARKFMLTKKNEVSFRKLIPMPQELEGTTVGLDRNTNQELVDKYGYDNWYDWSLANWGVKWDADSTHVTDQYISFSTAWGPADKYYLALSKKIPGLFIKVHYCDESGSPVGTLEFYRGIFTNEENQENNEEFYDEVWSTDQPF